MSKAKYLAYIRVMSKLIKNDKEYEKFLDNFLNEEFPVINIEKNNLSGE